MAALGDSCTTSTELAATHDQPPLPSSQLYQRQIGWNPARQPVSPQQAQVCGVFNAASGPRCSFHPCRYTHACSQCAGSRPCPLSMQPLEWEEASSIPVPPSSPRACPPPTSPGASGIALVKLGWAAATSPFNVYPHVVGFTFSSFLLLLFYFLFFSLGCVCVVMVPLISALPLFSALTQA